MSVRAAPNAMPIRGSARDLREGSMWRSSLNCPDDTGPQGPRTAGHRAAGNSQEPGARTRKGAQGERRRAKSALTRPRPGVWLVDMEGAAGRVMEELLRRSHLCAPEQLSTVAAQAAEPLGARELVLYLVDYELKTLSPVPGPHADDREPQAVRGTVAGRA